MAATLPIGNAVIDQCRSVEHPGWLSLREALRPECGRDEHLRDMAHACASPDRFLSLVAVDDDREPVGFAE
jgi:aminoglycoside 6'-N-acetyltransferase I